MRLHLSALGLVVLSSLAATAGCSDKGDPEADAPTVENTDTITLGMVLSLSGALANGDEAKRGAEVAVAQINALGGIQGGKRLVLELIDDRSSDVAARDAVTSLAEKGVVLGIGPSSNAAGVAMKELIKSDKVLFISPTATARALDLYSDDAAETAYPRDIDTAPEGTYPAFFRTAPTDSFLSTAIAQFASENLPTGRRCESIVIVAQTDDYGKPIAEFVNQRYRQLSLRVVQQIDLDPNLDNQNTLDNAASSSLSQLDARCQVVIAQPKVAGAYMRAVKRFQLNNPTARQSVGGFEQFLTIGSDGLRQNAFISEGRADPANPELATAGEDAFTLAADTAPEAELATPQFSAFANLHRARFPGIDTGRYASTAYDAVMLLAGAIERSGSTTDIVAIRKALYSVAKGDVSGTPITVYANDITQYFDHIRRGDNINYEGASGPCDFGRRDGNVQADFGVWQIENATFIRRRLFKSSELSGG